MVKNVNNMSGQKGSMMVEALAMLGLITMVTPILYKKAAERTTELQDINTATQMRTISKALDDYLKDNYSALAKQTEGEYVTNLTAEEVEDKIAPYLPYNFKMESRFFDEFKVAYRNDVQNLGTASEPRIHSALTGMVLANSKDGMPMVRASKIASMIGANGGVIRDKKISGVQGAWEADLDNYGFDNATKDGSIAVSSVHAVASEGGGAGSEHVLYRDDSKGDEDYNRMQVDLLMGGNDVREVARLIADPDGVPDLGTVANEVMIDAEDGRDAIFTVDGTANVNGLFKAGTMKIGALSGRDVPSPVFDVGSDYVKASKKVTIDTGAATNAALDVKGTTNMTGDVTITGKTEVTSGNAKVDIGKTAADTVMVKATTNVTGATTIDGQTIIKGTATATSGVSGDGDKYILSTEGNLLVNNNARVKGKLTVGTLEATNIHATGYVYADTNLKAGLNGGTYNLNVEGASASLQSNNFTVGKRFAANDTSAALYGGSATAQGPYKVYVDNTYAGIGNFTNSTTITDGMTATSDLVRVHSTNGSVSLKSKQGHVVVGTAGVAITHGLDGTYSNNPQYIQMTGNEFLMGNTDSNNVKERITMNANGITLDSGNSAKAVLGNKEAIVTADNLQLKSNESSNPTMFRVDGAHIMYADNVGNLAGDNTVLQKGFVVQRKGIIQLPGGVNASNAAVTGRTALAASAGKQDIPGYIKADRLLSNQAYEEPALDAYANDSSSYYGYRSGKTVYDAYQVNPAYTSVMHDIKLTTRGGARLSDILPDFINKGIYVIDNTYKEEKGKSNWENFTVSAGKVTNGPSECPADDARCIASPWLGFVPTPQCPPGYSKVITINPIRWKMAEAYVVTGDAQNVGDAAASFRAYFHVPTNPGASKFELNTASGSASHTHTVKTGQPLTFQTNTWLNTTISAAREGATGNTGRTPEFMGWHAIMGFLYYADEYSDYLSSVGGSGLGGKVVWNLFPVYNEEMTAIASVYCYFERRTITSAPAWGWKNNMVYHYDQMANFRSGFNKDATYVNRLNDPALGYNDPW